MIAVVLAIKRLRSTTWPPVTVVIPRGAITTRVLSDQRFASSSRPVCESVQAVDDRGIHSRTVARRAGEQQHARACEADFRRSHTFNDVPVASAEREF